LERNHGGVRLQARGVAKRFGGTNVLQALDLAAKPGEFVAIVGRSGCGKSTLLRLIAGLERPSEGSVVLDEAIVGGVQADTRVLFQDARLLPWKRVVDNVRIGVRDGNREEALEALRMVGLEEKANEWPAVLSGGQRQRVALARALVGRPRLLLLDEPLGALDALTRIEMQDLIERLWTEQGFTAILVTHDVSEAVALADRVVLIDRGRISLDATIQLPRPRERDSGFAHYEKLILDRVMDRSASARQAAAASFSI
jgi:sulfonate transport system ATP-binding protein